MKRHDIMDFKGYSMYPALRPGDRLIVRRFEPMALRIGDIVVRRKQDKTIVAHRLIRSQKGLVLTKGDAMILPDPEWIPVLKLEGRVVGVIRHGRLIPVATGLRESLKGIQAAMSRYGLTIGIIRARAKRLLRKASQSRHGLLPKTRKISLAHLLEMRISANSPFINWSETYETARQEGVSGLLYKRLRTRNPPPPVIDQFRADYYDIVSSNLRCLSALEQLGDVLHRDGITLLMLKGASLLDHVYKEIGVRPMGDLDIMVKAGDFPVVQKRLQGLGYVRESPNARIYQRGGVRIDLHNHPLNVDRIRARQALFPSGLGPVWASSEPWRPNLPNLRCPEDADNVIFLSQHLMKHSFSRLIWLVDIHRLLENRDHAFWTRLRERTYLFGQWRPLCYVIYLLNRLFGFAPPARSIFGGLPDRLTRLEKAVLDTSLYNGRCVLTGPLLSLFCVDDFRSRMKLASEILFPRWSIVKQEFGGGRAGNHLFFYPARLIRLTALVVREAIDIKRHAGPGNPREDG